MKVSTALLVPYWLGQIFTGAKSFLDNPLIGSPRLNEQGLHAFRVQLAHAMTQRRRARLSAALDCQDRETFDRDGVVAIRDFLPAHHFEALRDQITAYRGLARETVQGDTITRRLAMSPAAQAAIPAFEHFRAHPRWRSLSRYVSGFDLEPLLYLQSILPQRHEGQADPQLQFHADTFHPTMKAWLFLEDVPVETGPFAYVRGSHRLTPARLEWEQQRSVTVRNGDCRLSARGSFRVSNQELRQMGLPEPTIFNVPANTLVIADTVGFHARTEATVPATRTEIWAYARRNPFLPFSGIDPWQLLGLSDHRIGFRWWLGDKVDPWIRQAWKPAGIKGLSDE